MKLRQKIYDSSEQTNKLIKITNSYHHYKNLEKIKNRKPIYVNRNYPPKESTKQKTNIKLNDYYILRDNMKPKKNLVEIKYKKSDPEFNEQQNKFGNNLKESKFGNKNLDKENKNYKKRINNQRTFIDAKNINKEYNKALMNKRKKSGNKNIQLPSINNH